ncbi:uncharacterized protein ARMOST_11310 [Armillaria ostoyae]|uniref:Secreted protein n=1 Tax=Armillaria ostoyae TaxID=47428 RepID=A0A284RGT8_ARMOS|nr:uncharacterized protein ARMOST_11310 [Armillaria ostoyae]
MKRHLLSFLLNLATDVDTVRSVQVLLTAFVVVLPSTETRTRRSIFCTLESLSVAQTRRCNITVKPACQHAALLGQASWSPNLRLSLSLPISSLWSASF